MSDEISGYERYLHVPELLSLQKEADRLTCHDEMLFQIVHQVEELWMKLIQHEVTHAIRQMAADEVTAAAGTLRRINIAETLMTRQLELMETLTPRAYFTIRKGLGHASGQESPGFNAFLGVADSVWDAFTSLLGRQGATLFEIHMEPSSRPELFLLSEVLLDFDDRFQKFRFEHLKLVQRIIGGGTDSLKGVPAEVLKRSLEHRFFPELWDVREEIFASFTPGDLEI